MNNLFWGKTLFFLVLLPLFSFAQNTLTGTILDDEGQPLYGATVIIKGSNNGTVTDAQGQFNLNSQRSFPIEIEVSFVGFDNLTFTVENDQEITLGLPLTKTVLGAPLFQHIKYV